MLPLTLGAQLTLVYILSSAFSSSSFSVPPAQHKQKPCYYPNGKRIEGENYGNCPSHIRSSSGHSMCCDFTPGLNFTCLENGMCAGPEDSDSKRRVMVRGGCTDPTWKDEECRKICMWGDYLKDNAKLRHCRDGSFCCGEDNSVCCLRGEGRHLEGKIKFTTLSTFKTPSISSTSPLQSSGAVATTAATNKSPSASASASASSSASVSASSAASVSAPASAIASKEDASYKSENTYNAAALAVPNSLSANTSPQSGAAVATKASQLSSSTSTSTHSAKIPVETPSSDSGGGPPVGIIVGVIAVLLILGGAGGYFYWKRKKKGEGKNEGGSGQDGGDDSKTTYTRRDTEDWGHDASGQDSRRLDHQDSYDNNQYAGGAGATGSRSPSVSSSRSGDAPQQSRNRRDSEYGHSDDGKTQGGNRGRSNSDSADYVDITSPPRQMSRSPEPSSYSGMQHFMDHFHSRRNNH